VATVTAAGGKSITDVIESGTLLGFVSMMWETLARTLERVDALEVRVAELEAGGDAQ
jgi:hypothetical protein